MAGIDFVPATLRVRIQTAGKVVGDTAKVAIQIFYHFLERADFVKELKSVGKEHLIQQTAHAGRALASWPMIVLRIQGGRIGNSSVMLGMIVQRPQGSGERASQTRAKL